MARTKPCKFLLKDASSVTIDTDPQTGDTIRRVEKVVQKLDKDGNPMFEIKEVVVKKGCGCKGKKRTEKIVQKKIPITEKVIVEEKIETPTTSPSPLIICKLYGKVKKSFCEKCSTYKEKR